MRDIIIEKDGMHKLKESALKIIIRPNIKTVIFAESPEIEAKAEENAQVTLVTIGSAKTNAILEGDNSSIKTINLYRANSQEININATSEHIGKNTVSLIKTVGVLSQSKSTTKGLIKINETAENSDGYQKSEALVLNDSKAVSIPDLEIHNDKVRCTHGATISRIDKNQIFYLQSRGLDSEEAEDMLVDGFYESALKEIDDESIRDDIRETLKTLVVKT